MLYEEIFSGDGEIEDKRRLNEYEDRICIGGCSNIIEKKNQI